MRKLDCDEKNKLGRKPLTSDETNSTINARTVGSTDLHREDCAAYKQSIERQSTISKLDNHIVCSSRAFLNCPSPDHHDALPRISSARGDRTARSTEATNISGTMGPSRITRHAIRYSDMGWLSHGCVGVAAYNISRLIGIVIGKCSILHHHATTSIIYIRSLHLRHIYNDKCLWRGNNSNVSCRHT